MSTTPTRVAIVGCGNISDIYFKNLCDPKLQDVTVTACSDLDPAKTAAKTEAYGVPAIETEAIMASPAIDIVLNLTTPQGHHPIDMAALRAGKHVYAEKPLALALGEGREICDTADAAGLRVGSAPDTFLGAGIQTAIRVLNDGWIGTPVAATAFMLCPGHESWHPDPEFYYKAGGGPMFDMGPYYLTALVSMLGQVRRVTGSARISRPERVITSEAKYGTKVTVDVPTHVNGVLDFANGAIATIITSFDCYGHHLPPIEIHGTEGSMQVPDPNRFGGDVLVKRGRGPWQTMPHIHPKAENGRGLGLIDMARAIREKRPHRANGRLALHVLEIMQAVHDASDQGRHQDLATTCAGDDFPQPFLAE